MHTKIILSQCHCYLLGFGVKSYPSLSQQYSIVNSQLYTIETPKIRQRAIATLLVFGVLTFLVSNSIVNSQLYTIETLKTRQRAIATLSGFGIEAYLAQTQLSIVNFIP